MFTCDESLTIRKVLITPSSRMMVSSIRNGSVVPNLRWQCVSRVLMCATNASYPSVVIGAMLTAPPSIPPISWFGSGAVIHRESTHIPMIHRNDIKSILIVSWCSFVEISQVVCVWDLPVPDVGKWGDGCDWLRRQREFVRGHEMSCCKTEWDAPCTWVGGSQFDMGQTGFGIWLTWFGMRYTPFGSFFNHTCSILQIYVWYRQAYVWNFKHGVKHIKPICATWSNVFDKIACMWNNIEWSPIDTMYWLHTLVILNQYAAINNICEKIEYICGNIKLICANIEHMCAWLNIDAENIP